jgi:uncharacterized damage-inducible protein DinB
MSETSALEAPDLSLRYPIGKFAPPAESGEEATRSAIAALSTLPAELRTAVAGLSDAQLDTQYRPGGWTVRQLVHHVADSHINAYLRMRLALTEDWPAIKPYKEARWAELADARTLPVEISLSLLDSLHRRWVVLLESLTEGDWRRGYLHPESGEQTLETVVQLYRWHGLHHTAHVTALRTRSQW